MAKRIDGLMDCIVKHRNIIANLPYGLLDLVIVFYQLVVELLGAIFWVIYLVFLVYKNMVLFLVMFAGYALVQIGLMTFAAYIDTEKNRGRLLLWMQKLIFATIKEIFLQIPIMAARIIGLITFPWRRLKCRFLPYSFHPTLYVLILTTLTKSLPERMGLGSLFKGGLEERVKDTGGMG